MSCRCGLSVCPEIKKGLWVAIGIGPGAFWLIAPPCDSRDEAEALAATEFQMTTPGRSEVVATAVAQIKVRFVAKPREVQRTEVEPSNNEAKS